MGRKRKKKSERKKKNWKKYSLKEKPERNNLKETRKNWKKYSLKEKPDDSLTSILSRKKQ